MSFLGAFPQTFTAAGHPAETAAAAAALYQNYYAHGPSGETLYVWSTFPQSPELSPSSSDYSPPPPPYITSSPACPQGNLGLSTTHTSTIITDSGNVSVRTVKRRVTANRKERRRTLSINNAFADLRDCIPNVPADTKLSKIKTLRLATSYIAYLMDILAQDDPAKPPPPQITLKSEENKHEDSVGEKRKHDMASLLMSCTSASDRKSRGRTGWPQHVWALELKQETPT